MSANGAHLYTPADEAGGQEAATASRQIAAIQGAGNEAILLVHNGDEKIRIPMGALKMLREILDMMAKGDAISLTPIHAELTTQQAADLLNVSRPHFVKLLESGQGPAFHNVGRHRRILFKDLMEYRDEMKSKQNEALDELVAQAQELNMGY